MSKEFEVYIEYSMELEEFFKKLWNVLPSIKRDVESAVSAAKLYLFGSIVKGRYTYASDVDILIVLENLEGVDVDALKARIKGKHRSYPIELHVVDKSTFEKWYKRFIKPEELIELA
ncbi:MAG: nucleotidyltransferase domain-containing protein [Desulfurococcaceae archaeon]